MRGFATVPWAFTMHCSDVFPSCQISKPGGASSLPTQSWAELQTRRRQWDKTSEVPEVHGASRWWALSKAVKPHFLKRSLARTGAIPKAGSVENGTSTGDSTPEARHHKMGVGLTAATTSFMGDSYTFIDCPGSIEFAHDMRAAIAGGRCRRRGLRGRREEAAAVADHPARARRPRHSPLFVSQQDRPRQQAHPRDARDLAAGIADSAGAAPDPDLERRS